MMVMVRLSWVLCLDVVSTYINIKLKSIQFADVITCMYISTDALFEFPFPVKNSIESNLRLQIVLNCLMHS